MADQHEPDQDPSEGEHLDHSNNYYGDLMMKMEAGDQAARGIVEKMGGIVLGMTGGKEQVRRMSVYSHLGEQDVFDICFEDSWQESNKRLAQDKKMLNFKEIVEYSKGATQSLSAESSKSSITDMEVEGNPPLFTFHQGSVTKSPQLSESHCFFNKDPCDGHSSVSLPGDERLEEKVFKNEPIQKVVNFAMECVQNSYNDSNDIHYPDAPASQWPVHEKAFCDNGDVIPSPKKSNFISIRPITEAEDNMLYESVCNAMTNYRSVVSQVSYQPWKRRRSRRRQSLMRFREMAGDGYDSDESFHSSFSDSTSLVDNYYDADRYSDEEMPLANDELPEWTLDSSEYSFYDPLEPGDNNPTFYPYGEFREPRAPPPSPHDGSPPLPSSNIRHLLSSSSRSRSPISIGLSQNEVKTSDDNATMPVLSFFHQPLDFWIFEVD